VQCSGTMLIESGVIKRIRINSGHYQPGVSNVRALVMALRMWGVPMGQIVFEDYKGFRSARREACRTFSTPQAAWTS